jgi:hypothetical protein
MSTYQSAKPQTVVWLTPPEITKSLGGAESFDLDPCSLNPRPFATAKHHLYLPDYDGLTEEWYGRVWLNPPYTSGEVGQWLRRLSEHGIGTSLIFARTETEHFSKYVWNRADSLLFIHGRLAFYRPDGRKGDTATAPSVLCAYGNEDTERLAQSGIKGTFVPLRLSKGVLCLMWSQLPSWNEAIQEWIRSRNGSVSLSDAYKEFARHPKAEKNPNWKAKIRQVLQRSDYIRVARTV